MKMQSEDLNGREAASALNDDNLNTEKNRPWAIFFVFLKLGMSAFGGPVAHLSFFREAFVKQKRWLSDQAYADLVALCQFLPGPASSQVGIALGYQQAGYRGALAAWTGFTLPSVLLMSAFAWGLQSFGQGSFGGVISALKLVAVAVVAQALWGMAQSLCPDRPRQSLMVLSAVLMLAVPNLLGQLAVITLSALVGYLLLPQISDCDEMAGQHHGAANNTSKRSLRFLLAFIALLLGLPWLSQALGFESLQVFESFYRTGAMVFGGGHVVLPLLNTEVVATGWVSEADFLAGYGAVQAVPGPLFTFTAYLGSVSDIGPGGLSGALLATAAVFLPSFLLVFAALPYWEQLRQNQRIRKALVGVNAGVVGLLLAALINPIGLSAMHSTSDWAFALLAWLALQVWKLPVWAVVIGAGLAGAVLFV